MRKIIGLLLTAVLLCCAPLAVQGDTIIQVRFDLSYQYDMTENMMEMINAFRTSEDAWYWNEDDQTKTTIDNLTPLAFDYGLEKIAMQRAAECAVSYSHTRPNGTKCFTLYPGSGYRGENIAVGYTSMQSVFNAWREDDCSYSGQGHRRNLLNSNFKYIGIGCVYSGGRYFWCQAFSSNGTGETQDLLSGPAVVDVSVDALGSQIRNLSADPSMLKIQEGTSADLPEVTCNISTWSSTRFTILDPQWISGNAAVLSVSAGKVNALAGGKTTLSVDLGEGLTVQAVSVCNNHSWNDGSEVTPPTCTEAGIMLFTCTACGETTEEQGQLALGHDIEHHEAKTPTCTEIGWEAYDTCTRCNYSTYEEKTALGHDIERHEAKTPTCTEIGWEAYDTCTRCNYSTYEEKTALGHDIERHEAKAPTCTETGWEAYDTCTRCNYSTYEEKTALGHDIEHHEAKVPTCTETGWDAYDTCTRCEYSTYAEKPAL